MKRVVDIHSHLNDPRFDADLPEVLLCMRAAEVSSIVVGTDPTMSERAIVLAEHEPDLWATVGLHPADDVLEQFKLSYYEKLARHQKVVAIGECGLDYNYIANFFEKDKKEKALSWNKDAEADRQRELFDRQIELAVLVDKPLMIHGRPSRGTMDAYEDILFMLKNAQLAHGEKVRGNIHFFVGDIAIARQFLDLGFTMSFTGVLTFAREYDEVVRYLPPERIMAETDAPYVAPLPHRGKRNEPAFVRETVSALAGIRGEDPEDLRETLFRNAERVFRLPGINSLG